MKKYLESKSLMISFCILLIICFCAIFAGWLAPYDPLAVDSSNTLQGTGVSHLLGTDEFGRDILSRMLIGLRPTLIISLVGTFLAMFFGTAIGMVAGYFGKFCEQLIMRIVDIVLCFPSMLLAVMVVSFWKSGISSLIVTIAIVYTPTFARLAYSSTLKVKSQDYIKAQISLGAGPLRVIGKGILPNIFSSVLVQMSLTFGNAILLESGLSFLGIGVVPPTPSLGQMIGDAKEFLQSSITYLIYPSILLAAMILCINVAGDSLRDILDPKLHRQ